MRRPEDYFWHHDGGSGLSDFLYWTSVGGLLSSHMMLVPENHLHKAYYQSLVKWKIPSQNQWWWPLLNVTWLFPQLTSHWHNMFYWQAVLSVANGVQTIVCGSRPVGFRSETSGWAIGTSSSIGLLKLSVKVTLTDQCKKLCDIKLVCSASSTSFKSFHMIFTSHQRDAAQLKDISVFRSHENQSITVLASVNFLVSASYILSQVFRTLHHPHSPLFFTLNQSISQSLSQLINYHSFRFLISIRMTHLIHHWENGNSHGRQKSINKGPIQIVICHLPRSVYILSILTFFTCITVVSLLPIFFKNSINLCICKL